jgi:mono/diheme cytochrome c family protein
MTRTLMTMGLSMALALVAACGGETEPAATNASLTPANLDAAPAASPAARPLALEGEALARAVGIFDATCSTCHLASGKGDPHHRKDDIPDFTDRAWQTGETDAELRDAIANGTGKVMPAFGEKLSGDQIDELVAYVRGFPDRPAPADERAEPIRHDRRDAPKPAARNVERPRRAAPKAARPEAPAPKEDHDGHGDHPQH